MMRVFTAYIVGYDDDTYEADKTRQFIDGTRPGRMILADYSDPDSFRRAIEKIFPDWRVKSMDEIDRDVIGTGILSADLVPADGCSRKNGLTRWHCNMMEMI